MAKQRIEYIDFLKFFAIFSVLIGHSTEQLSGQVFWDHPVWSFIYTYHMPLFMMLSGIFFKSSLRQSFFPMLKKKFMQLGVPSICCWLLVVAYVAIMCYNPNPDLIFSGFNGFMVWVWFLKCVLLCYVIMYGVVKLMRKDWLAAIVASVVVLFIPGTQQAYLNFMLPMFCMGMLVGNHAEFVKRHRKSLFAVSLSLFVAMLFGWNGHMTVYEVPIDFFDWKTMSFDAGNFKTMIYRMTIGMAGSMLFYTAAPFVYGKIKEMRITPLLNRMGTKTLGIYVMQTYFLELLFNTLKIYIPLPWSILAALLLAVVELCVCYGMVMLFRKSRVLGILFLGEE